MVIRKGNIPILMTVILRACLCIDAQRGDADSCLHPPPAYFFRQDRRPTSSHKAAPRRATQDIRRQADADRHW